MKPMGQKEPPMGTVTINSGTKVAVEEVEGDATLQQLYEDVACEHYTDIYREKCIRAWGKLARQGWGILPVLHELTKGNNDTLKEAAKQAIKKIDPGAPNLTGKIESTVMAPMTRPGGHHTGPIASVTKPDNRFPVQNGHTTVWKKPEIKKVTFTEIEVGNDLSVGTRISSGCSFCEKQTVFTNKLREVSDILAGPKKLYCNFCLRNELYRPKNRHTMMMSFRGIIGYYYHCFHMAKTCSMFMADLEAYIDLHVKFGIQNPLFRYDAESFVWFVDFSKVGSKQGQMPLKYVLETVISILSTFNLYDNVKDSSPAAFFLKYKEAINDFHHHRRRPPNQRILTPTLYSCGIPHETALNRAISVNVLRNFTPSNMIENFKVARRGGYI